MEENYNPNVPPPPTKKKKKKKKDAWNRSIKQAV